MAIDIKVGFLITARLKSTRLPNKIVLKIFDRELIAWMLDRLKLSPVLDEIVITTSTNPQDDLLYELAEREGVSCFRGSEDDVLARLYGAAVEYELDYIVNITADNPLVAHDWIEKVVATYRETEADLITCYDLPLGLFLYGIKIKALAKVLEIKDDEDTEVWGSYFMDTGLFKVVEMEVPAELHRPEYRLTLDYQQDFDLLKAIFDGMGPETYRKTSFEIVEYLDAHPEISCMNRECQKAFLERLESQRSFKLK